uniref:Uncharacterized protein n=1 Tax=Micrurus corallinus TaxID=54390 RepID=A0A2D4GR71_MICCO
MFSLLDYYYYFLKWRIKSKFLSRSRVKTRLGTLYIRKYKAILTETAIDFKMPFPAVEPNNGTHFLKKVLESGEKNKQPNATETWEVKCFQKSSPIWVGVYSRGYKDLPMKSEPTLF